MFHAIKIFQIELQHSMNESSPNSRENKVEGESINKIIMMPTSWIE